jgi:hypothetical protein
MKVRYTPRAFADREACDEIAMVHIRHAARRPREGEGR